MKHTLAYLTALLVLVRFTYAQSTLSGTVKDQNNDGVPGATVKIEGTDQTTLTDINGAFTLQLTDGYETLVISKEGFQTQKIYLTGQITVSITLKSVAQSSDQVSLGIGSQSKDQLTSSVSSVNSENMIQAPLVNLEQANQGVTAGLQVQNSSGTLGEDTKVRIRGGSSLTGSNDPLYVVDGVPLVSGNQSNINPNNIASMEVLKDASATAIYGTRAANGVIIITTKSGGSGNMKVNVDYQLGIANTPKRLDLFDNEEHLRLVFEYTVRNQIQILEPGAGGPLQILVNGQVTPMSRSFIENNYTQYDAISFRDPTGRIVGDIPLAKNTYIDSLIYNTDWQDEIFRSAISHTANVDVQGGKEQLNYFVSAGYTSQEGILLGNSFDRFNGAVSLNSKMSESLSASLDFNFIRTEDERLRDNQDLGFPLQALALPPSDSYDPTRNDSLFVFGGRNFYNPITEINHSNNFSYENSYIGSLSLNYKVNDNISFDINGGIDFSDIDDELELQPVTLDGNPNGRTLVNEQNIRNYVLNGWATYGDSYSNGNSLSIIIGGSYQESNATFKITEALVPSIEQLMALDENSPLVSNVLVPGSANVLVSTYGRISYSIGPKYDFQVTGRMDGSSKFSESNRFGFFPAVSAGWNIHNEDFYAGAGKLRLRASYGIVGNTPFDDFAYRRNYVTVNFEDGETIEAIDIANSNLKWETTSQLNVGMDFGFLDDRLSGSIDYYIKNTKDLLFPRPISLTSGQSSVLSNFGEMENKGFELFISSENIRLNNFSWTTDFNISSNKNLITNLEGNQAVVGVNAYIENQPAGVFYAREFLGVDVNTGDALYSDANGNPTANINNAALRIIGDPNPDYFGGVNNTLTVGNFDFSFLIQFVQGNDMYFATGEQLANSGINLQGQLNSQIDRWYGPGDVAANPVLDIDGNPPVESSRWIVDGSYVRLKNVMLTFNLPSEKLSQLGLRHLSVYVGATNLFTITNYPGYDPDVSYADPLNGQIGQNISRGIDNFSTPQSRMIMTGIKFGI